MIPNQAPKSSPNNLRIVGMCLALVAAMGGLAYASVPLYQLFCQVTGYGGTTRQVTNAEGIEILDHKVTVRFDANSAPGLNWAFYPEQRDVTLRLGETMLVNYIVENRSGRDLTGTATFNVTPQALGAYFNKIECFCFTETNVKSGEKLVMPVVFFVDPDMLNQEETKNFETLTLSYTFFPDRDKNEAVVSSDEEDTKPNSVGG